jgi:hypothetical protein
MKNHKLFESVGKRLIGWVAVYGLLVIYLLTGTASKLLASSDPLSSGFANPPVSAWPWVYCFWLDGNVTREGITADLEAMKLAGIGGALIMDGSLFNPKGPVHFFSPEWQELFRHMLAEADRLGLEINMNNDPGWAGSGGAWVRPDQASQRVVFSEMKVTGPSRFDAVPDMPPININTYRDIAMLAFPAPDTEANGNFHRLEIIKSGKSFDGRGDFAECVTWPRHISIPAKWQTLPTGQCVPSHTVMELTQKMDANGRLVWDVPPGEWVVMRIGHTPTGSSTRMAPPEGAGLECDKLSKSAVKAHFDAMIGKLAENAGTLAGKSLVSTHIDSWEAGSGNWTPDFREEFQRRRGYDLLPYLPVLNGIMVESLEVSERFLWDLRETVNDLVLENYSGYLRDLAKEKGLPLSIEAYDGTVDDLRYAGRADEPMTEFWQGGCYEGLNLCDLTEEMTSAAHVYGKNIVGAEAYSAWVGRGYTDYPATLKPLGDWALGQGVNRFCIAEWIMQPWTQRSPGLCFSNIGTQYGRTLSWWEQSKVWHKYLARCQFMLRQGLFVADVCFLQPEGAPNRFVAPIPATFRAYPTERPEYNFDGCPAEVVLTRMSVRDGRLVLPDGMNYRLLVLPSYNADGQPVFQLDSTTYKYSARPMPKTETMTPALLRKIRELVEAGATVLGTRPLKSPGLSGFPECDNEIRRLADDLWGKDAGASGEGSHTLGKGRVIWGKTPGQVLSGMGIMPDFQCGTGQPFRAIHRSMEDGTELYFVANRMDQIIDRVCTFRVKGKSPEIWIPETGSIKHPELYDADKSGISIPIRLEPNESVFVVFRAGELFPDRHFIRVMRDGYQVISTYPGGELPFTASPLVPQVNVQGKPYLTEWNISAAGPDVQVFREDDKNVKAIFREGGVYEFFRANGETQKFTVPSPPAPLELEGTWNLQFKPGLGAPEQVTLDKLISWHMLSDPGVKYFSGSAVYRKTFLLPDAWHQPERLVILDLGRVKVIASVKVNGHDLGILWRAPFRLDITSALVAGQNTLEVTVANLPVNRMIGDEQLPADSEYGEYGELKAWPQWLLDGKPSPAGRYTFTSWRLYKKDDPLMESGLLGPVTLQSYIYLTIDPPTPPRRF